MKTLGQVAVHALLPTLVGSLLYLGWRTDALVAWAWADQLGIAEIGMLLRRGLTSLPINLPEWVRFTLPDALWVYALTWSVARPWANDRGVEAVLWLAIPMLLGVGAELGQAVGAVPGTFDPLDLASCVVAMGLALWVAWRDGSADSHSVAPAPSAA